MRRNPRAAFTFLELIIVIIILGIIFSVSTPRFRATYTTIRLRSTSQDIINLSRLIRQEAILKRSIHRLELNKAASAGQKFIVYRKQGSNYIEDKDRLSAVEIPGNIAVEIKNPVHFYPDGTMDMVDTEIVLNSGVKEVTLEPSKTKGFIRKGP